jgi:hypothetical protein
MRGQGARVGENVQLAQEQRLRGKFEVDESTSTEDIFVVVRKLRCLNTLTP